MIAALLTEKRNGVNLLLGPLLSENCTWRWQEFVKMIKIGQDDQDWSRLDKIIKSDQDIKIG